MKKFAFVFCAFFIILSTSVYAQVQLDATGSANAFAVTYPAVIVSAPSGGIEFTFKANHTITGAATLDLNSTGPKQIYKNFDKPLEANDIKAGHYVKVIYDNSGGGSWQMVGASANPLPSGAIAGGGTVKGVGFFNSTSTLTADGTNFVWDNANKRLGIGTASPIYKIELTTQNNEGIGLNANGTTNANTGFYFNSTIVSPPQQTSATIALKNGTGDKVLQFFNSTPSLGTTEPAYAFLDNSTNRILTLHNNGNVAIGVVVPNYNLHINSSTASPAQIGLTNTNASGDVRFEMRTNSTVGAQYLEFTTGSTGANTPDYTNRIYSNQTFLAFERAAGTTMFIENATGNIGINNNSPNQRLTVGGNISTTGIVFMQNAQINALANGILSVNGTGNVVLAPAIGDNLGNHTATTTIKALDGTAGAPSYTFDSNQTSGMYLINTNMLGIATNGTNRILYDGFGHSLTPPSANGFTINVGGAAAFGLYGTLDASASNAPVNGLVVSGNVGIGTSTPGQNLVVVGNTSVTGNSTITGTSISTNTRVTSLSNAIVSVNGVGQLVAAPAGSGLTGSGATSQIAFWASANSLSGSNALWWDRTNSFLGIGFQFPGDAIQFSGDRNQAITVSNATSGAGKDLGIESGDAQTGGTNLSSGQLLLMTGQSTGSAFGGDISFKTSQGGTSGTAFRAQTDRMIIKSTGRVGIGTVNPNAELHVVGNSTVTGTSMMQNAQIASLTNGVLSVNGTGNVVLAPAGGSLSGSGTNGAVNFWTGTSTQSADAINFFWDNTTKRLGINTNVPSYAIALGGDINREIGMNRSPTANGSTLALIAGGGQAGGTNRGGGSLDLMSGVSTGNANSVIRFLTSFGIVSGVVDNNQTEKMRIDGNGNVGIGTASPIEQLTIANDAPISILSMSYVPGANGASVLRLHKARGTRASPAAILSGDVIGRVNFAGQYGTGAGQYDGGFGMRGEATENFTSATNVGGKLIFTTTQNTTGTAIDRMIIDQNGNVGIGTNNPDTKLSIFGGAMNIHAGIGNGANRPSLSAVPIPGEIAGTYSPGADFGYLRISAGGYNSTTNKSFIDLSGFSTIPDMDRNIVLGTSGLERMRIAANGNIGIGTITPGATLDVNGNAFIRGNFLGIGGATTPIGSSSLVVQADNGAGSYGGMFINANGTGLPFYGYALGGANNVWHYVDGADGNKWKLYHTGLTPITVQSNGNVGIGTTAPNARLDVLGSTAQAIAITATSLTLDNTHSTIIIVGGAGLTMTIPAAATCTRRIYLIVNNTAAAHAFSINYVAFGGGSASTIFANAPIAIQSDGINWYRIQ